jgi:hypothetical protein
VTVNIHVRFQRCPDRWRWVTWFTARRSSGEKVRLFTTDRRSRFTFDSETKVSHWNEQTSEEHYAMSAWVTSCPISP